MSGSLCRCLVHYGHKINLTTGVSRLVLYAVIERGNPADETRFMPMLERFQKIYSQLPSQVAVDGGYSSQANLTTAKAIGVEDVGVHKRRNLSIDDMTGGDHWLYRELRNFRAGIEAGIRYLKRCFGLRRVHWKGWEHFCASIWTSIFTHNLVRLARSGLQKSVEHAKCRVPIGPDGALPPCALETAENPMKRLKISL